MRLDLTRQWANGAPSYIEIDDEPSEDGRVQISIDSWPSCEGIGDTVAVNATEAAGIVAHLQLVFEMWELI